MIFHSIFHFIYIQSTEMFYTCTIRTIIQHDNNTAYKQPKYAFSIGIDPKTNRTSESGTCWHKHSIWRFTYCELSCSYEFRLDIIIIINSTILTLWLKSANKSCFCWMSDAGVNNMCSVHAIFDWLIELETNSMKI